MLIEPKSVGLRSRASSVVETDDASVSLRSLPSGWRWVKLSEVCSKVQDGTHFSPKDQSQSGRFKYITAKNIKHWGLDLSKLTYVPEATHREIYNRCNPEKGDVLYIKDGVTTGIATVNSLDEEFSLLSSVALLKPKREILDPRFLSYYLNSPEGFRNMTGQMTGTAIKRLILQKIKAAVLPLAPLDEQQRIVPEIEKQFTRLEAGVASLKRVQAALKRYRASVLKAACEGRLVPTEAELARRESRSYEPATTLLARILVERRENWTGRGKYREPEAVAAAELPQLPEGWTWATPDQLSAFDEGAICAGPFGTIFKARDFRSQGVPIIFLRHVAPGRYLTHKPGFMDAAKWQELFRPYSVLVASCLSRSSANRPASIHSHYEDKKILFTFNTQSLYNQVRSLITRFYRVHHVKDPNWDVLHVRHAWGGARRPGVYSDHCKRHGRDPLTLTDARAHDRDQPFRACCATAVTAGVQPYYDFVLVDEAQDFPTNFFELLWMLSADEHCIYYAYDELQSLSSLEMPNPKDLFGRNPDGTDRFQIEGEYPGPIEKVLTLTKSYRCPRDVLMLAHGVGLGIHGPRGPVQMLERASSWRALGYDPGESVLGMGHEVVIERPAENSPNIIAEVYEGARPLVSIQGFSTRNDELQAVANSIANDINVEGVPAHNIVVISLDSINAKKFMSDVQRRLHAYVR